MNDSTEDVTEPSSGPLLFEVRVRSGKITSILAPHGTADGTFYVPVGTQDMFDALLAEEEDKQ